MLSARLAVVARARDRKGLAPRLAGPERSAALDSLTPRFAGMPPKSGTFIYCCEILIGTRMNFCFESGRRMRIIGCWWMSVLLFACGGKKQEVVTVNVAEGKMIYESNCKTCHGGAGEGNGALKAPSLTGLGEWYMFRQVLNFRNDIRGTAATDTLGRQMAAMVKTLKDTLAVRNVAAYIASLPDASAAETLTGNWKNGENIYQSICGSCHGAEGKGNVKLDAPRLRSLPSWYLKDQFEKFRSGQRGTHPEDKFGAQMVAMVEMVKDEQSLLDVITYLRSELPAAK
jgi:cytochrome c553